MSKSYCAKLWNHQYVHMSGSLRYCCATMENLKDKKGNRLHINNDSLENAWNSDDIKEARLKMMRGESVPACVKCVEQEERGYQSMRESQDMENNFTLTKQDGSVVNYPNSMELHLGNLCNLKCKMCGQQYSNQIGKELLEIGQSEPDFLEWIRKESGNVNIWTNNLKVEYRWFQNSKIKNRLFNYIAEHITELIVIGGEPTVIPEFWELFEYLEQRGRLNDMSITLTTNLTNVNPKMTNWLPRLKSWTVWASVDGLGERTEYIRYPSNFKKVCDNLDFYKGLLAHNNGKIVLSPAIQLLNIDQLDDILKWWLQFSEGTLDDKFGVSWMAQVWYPTICNYDILPSEYKEKIADKLSLSTDEFKNYPMIYSFYKNQIENLRKDIYTEEKKKHFQEAFVRYNDTQDRHRKGKTWRQLMPDLEQALTKSIG
jgi:MoaA/NifB/PqqE/SkfB family radical SAM enzyme